MSYQCMKLRCQSLLRFNDNRGFEIKIGEDAFYISEIYNYDTKRNKKYIEIGNMHLQYLHECKQFQGW